MFTNEKNQGFEFLKSRKMILPVFLLFCVASSKGIIIYNEETLVALSFAAFVIFSYSYFGNTIKESFDERSALIENGFDNLHRLKRESLQKLLSFHKRTLQLKKVFPALQKDNENRVLHSTFADCVYVTSTKQKSGKTISASQKKKGLSRFKCATDSLELYNDSCENIMQKLAIFKSSKSRVQERLQESLSAVLNGFVLCQMSVIKQTKNSKEISKQVKRSLKLLAV